MIKTRPRSQVFPNGGTLKESLCCGCTTVVSLIDVYVCQDCGMCLEGEINSLDQFEEID